MRYENGKRYFTQTYPKIFNSGFIGRIMDFQHKSMEWGLREKFVERILELGSGKSDHIRFVKQIFSEYHETDFYLEALPQRSSQTSLKQFQLDATDLKSIANDEYDRIIASCLLIHLDDIQGSLSQWLRILKPGGTLSLLIPCEPGVVLRFSRMFSTRKKAKVYGLDYDKLHYSEHKSYFLRAEYYVNQLSNFANIKWRYFPFFVHSWNLNLWSVVHIKKK